MKTSPLVYNQETNKHLKMKKGKQEDMNNHSYHKRQELSLWKCI